MQIHLEINARRPQRRVFNSILIYIPIVNHSPVFHSTGGKIRKSDMIVLHQCTLPHLVILDTEVIIQFVGDPKTDVGSVFMLGGDALAGDDLEGFGSGAS